MESNFFALTRSTKKAKGMESTLLNNNLRGSLEDFPIAFSNTNSLRWDAGWISEGVSEGKF